MSKRASSFSYFFPLHNQLKLLKCMRPILKLMLLIILASSVRSSTCPSSVSSSNAITNQTISFEADSFPLILKAIQGQISNNFYQLYQSARCLPKKQAIGCTTLRRLDIDGSQTWIKVIDKNPLAKSLAINTKEQYILIGTMDSYIIMNKLRTDTGLIDSIVKFHFFLNSKDDWKSSISKLYFSIIIINAFAMFIIIYFDLLWKLAEKILSFLRIIKREGAPEEVKTEEQKEEINNIIENNYHNNFILREEVKQNRILNDKQNIHEEEEKIPHNPQNNGFNHVFDETGSNEEDLNINESKLELNRPKYKPKIEYLQRETHN